jgi:hypothetical protein
MKVCLSCYNILVDDYKEDFCPLRECQGPAVNLDENIVPAIIKLNKKNYKTIFSCSGHPTREYLDCYIAFDESIDIDSSPEGFILQKFQDENMVVHNVIRSNISDEDWALISTEDRIRKIADLNISILKWAEALPSLEIKL